MATYRELIYIVIDELKIPSDDSYITEDHIAFLLRKYRAFILKQQYENKSKAIPEANKQTLCLDLIETPAIEEDLCTGGVYLRTTAKIPDVIVGGLNISTVDSIGGTLTYVSKERLPYVGNNKWLTNFIYAAKNSDNYIYLKSANPQFLYLDKIKVTGVFDDSEAVIKLMCSGDNDHCDPWDNEYPLESGLISMLTDLVVKELSTVIYRPEDRVNDANDGTDEYNSQKQTAVARAARGQYVG